MSAEERFALNTKGKPYRLKAGESFSVKMLFPLPALRVVLVTLRCSCGAKLVQKGRRLVCCRKACRCKGLTLKQARGILEGDTPHPSALSRKGRGGNEGGRRT